MRRRFGVFPLSPFSVADGFDFALCPRRMMKKAISAIAPNRTTPPTTLPAIIPVRAVLSSFSVLGDGVEGGGFGLGVSEEVVVGVVVWGIWFVVEEVAGGTVTTNVPAASINMSVQILMFQEGAMSTDNIPAGFRL
jgi:hypothetical protein